MVIHGLITQFTHEMSEQGGILLHAGALPDIEKAAAHRHVFIDIFKLGAEFLNKIVEIDPTVDTLNTTMCVAVLAPPS